MELERPGIVRSLAGHDRGGLFCVLGADGPYLLLCDGKRREVEAPKREKAGHAADAGGVQHPGLEKPRAGPPTTHREGWRALAAFRAEESRRV